MSRTGWVAAMAAVVAASGCMGTATRAHVRRPQATPSTLFSANLGRFGSKAALEADGWVIEETNPTITPPVGTWKTVATIAHSDGRPTETIITEEKIKASYGIVQFSKGLQLHAYSDGREGRVKMARAIPTSPGGRAFLKLQGGTSGRPLGAPRFFIRVGGREVTVDQAKHGIEVAGGGSLEFEVIAPVGPPSPPTTIATTRRLSGPPGRGGEVTCSTDTTTNEFEKPGNSEGILTLGKVAVLSWNPSQLRYRSSASVTGSVLDGGRAGTWTALLASTDEPGGTMVRYFEHHGNIRRPDATWSPWVAVTPGPLSAGGRFIQFRVDLETADDRTTPTVRDVRGYFQPTFDTTSDDRISEAPAGDARVRYGRVRVDGNTRWSALPSPPAPDDADYHVTISGHKVYEVTTTAVVDRRGTVTMQPELAGLTREEVGRLGIRRWDGRRWNILDSTVNVTSEVVAKTTDAPLGVFGLFKRRAGARSRAAPHLLE